MFQLKEGQYHTVMPILDLVPFNTLFARSVLKGDIAGEVFTDSVLQPRACYIVHPYGMSLLAGDSADDCFRQFVSDRIFKNTQRKSAEWLQVYPSLWSDLAADWAGNHLLVYPDHGNQDADSYFETFGKDHVVRWGRLNFSFDRLVFETFKSKLPEGFRIARIDSGFGVIKGAVVPKYFWNNSEEFLSKGAGFCVLKGQEVVSTAFSAYTTELQLEIGIETAVAYRGMGLAAQAGAALIRYCLENKLEPVWSCRKQNTGSVKLAEKLGFVVTQNLPYYSLP